MPIPILTLILRLLDRFTIDPCAVLYHKFPGVLAYYAKHLFLSLIEEACSTRQILLGEPEESTFM